MLRDGRKFNFVIIENDIIDDFEKFDKNDLLCYMALCRFANNNTGECYPSYATIAKYMRVGTSTAMKSVKSLIEKGVISVEARKDNNGGDTSNLYTILSISNEEKEKAPISSAKYTSATKTKPNNSIHNKSKKNTTKTKFHNFEETFTNYSEEQLEKIIEDQQTKFDSRKESTQTIEKNIDDIDLRCKAIEALRSQIVGFSYMDKEQREMHIEHKIKEFALEG